jgi:CRP/FNR family cyclic AMP-dependent transcriptional regulator
MNNKLPDILLKRLDAFISDSGLPRPLVEDLIGHHTVVSYPKGSTIFLQGSPADVLFFVFAGIIEVYCPQHDSSRVLVRLCGPGEIVGHVDFIDQKQRRVQRFEAIARTKCELALFTRDHIFKLLKTLDQAHLIRLFEYLNTMWSSVSSAWAAFVGLDYRQRLELVLKDLAERFGVKDSRGTVLITELLHAKLAEMIGSSRPMITRLINEMIAQGVIARRGKQYILLDRPGELTHENAGSNHNGTHRDSGPRAKGDPRVESEVAISAEARALRPISSNMLSAAHNGATRVPMKS